MFWGYSPLEVQFLWGLSQRSRIHLPVGEMGRTLGLEDFLEKEMATHSRVLAWEMPWKEEPAGSSLWGRKEFDTTE